MRKQIYWRKMRIMRIMRNKDEKVCLSLSIYPGINASYACYAQLLHWLREVTHRYAKLRSLRVVTSQCTVRLRRVTVLYADLLGLLRMVTQFYWDCYAWLRRFSGMVTHIYASLH